MTGNYRFQQKQNNGFNARGFLLSNLKFSGVCRIMEISEHFKKSYDGEQQDARYWIVKDENGARFSTFDENVRNSLSVGENYQLEGEIRISKGSTYLNLKEVRSMNGSEFNSKYEDDTFRHDMRIKFEEIFGADSQEVKRLNWALENGSLSTLATLEEKLEQALAFQVEESEL